jgi:hypothetical protein
MPMFGPPLSKVLAALAALSATFLLVVAGSTATFLAGRYLAVRVAGMSEIEFLRDSIVAGSSIVIHLTVDRFLHRVSRHARCLRATPSLSALIRKFLTRR